MARLDEAEQRLQAAIARLERALEARLADTAQNADAQAKGAAPDGAAPDGEELARLQAECERLRGENATLRAANADADRRLDSALSRLNGVLEG
jgi:hypothetical protein